jgi:pyruvate/2-oxoglutarate dehydrogenase complex dihydrolipoamide acyltransferase (E2) component
VGVSVGRSVAVGDSSASVVLAASAGKASVAEATSVGVASSKTVPCCTAGAAVPLSSWVRIPRTNVIMASTKQAAMTIPAAGRNTRSASSETNRHRKNVRDAVDFGPDVERLGAEAGIGATEFMGNANGCGPLRDRTS